MAGKRTVLPSPESLARAERQRLAKEEGVQAMVEVVQQAIDVRHNMQRLKALREAQQINSPPAAKTRKVRTKRAAKTSKDVPG
jgi:adenylyl- and sulfurtransferase ThiI